MRIAFRSKPTRFRLAAGAALAVLGLPAAALAQVAQAPAPDEAGASAAVQVSGVVVTADRTPVPVSQVASSVTVLTGQDIRRDQETSLADILARTPGVDVARNGGPGGVTSLFIRGADSAQTVVLIDGVRVNDPSSPAGAFDFSSVLAGDISRVEVLRGPQSTLYGSDAIGGVVNIVTASPTRPFEADVRAEGGSYGESYASAAIGGKDGRVEWRAAAWSDADKGAPCLDPELGGTRPCAFHTTGASGRLGVELTPDLQLDQRAWYSWSRTDTDGYDTPTFSFGDDEEYAHAQSWVDYTGLNLKLLDGRLKNRLAFEYSAIDRNDQDPQQFGTTTTFLSHGRTGTVEYEGTFAITPVWTAVFGAERARSTYISLAPAFQPAPDRAHQTINSGYAQVSGEALPGLTLTGGVRYDDQTRVGGHTTGQASAAWRLNGGNTILRASFGQGFKAPSLYELYSEFGNLALRPEQANGWDAGVEQHFLDGRLVVQATYFGRVTRDLIDFVSCYGVTTGPCATNVSGGYYDNVAKARAEGAEVQASWRATDRLTLSGNYTFDDVEDRSPGSPDLGRQLARRPKHAGNVDAGYRWPGGLTTDVALRYEGDRFDDAAHAVPLRAYTLVDLRAAYPLCKRIELYARVENLTNQHYETVFEYGTMKLAAFGGVRVRY